MAPTLRVLGTDEIRESDIGTGAGLFEVRKIGDEFFTFIVDCKVGVAVVGVCECLWVCDCSAHVRRVGGGDKKGGCVTSSKRFGGVRVP